MSDPHVGSFAVIFTVLYFILQFGLFTEIDGVRAAIIPACGFVLSRTLSGFAAVTFKCAKKMEHSRASLNLLISETQLYF